MKSIIFKITRFKRAKICLLFILILNFETILSCGNPSNSDQPEESPYALEWQKKWDIKDADRANCISVDKAKGNIYVSGHSSYPAYEAPSDLFLLKINAYGEEYWCKTWINYCQNTPMGMVIDSHHDIYLVVNEFGGQVTEYLRTYLLKYNSSGGVQVEKVLQGYDSDYHYQRSFGGYYPDYGFGQMDMAIDTMDSLYFVGTTISFDEVINFAKIFVDKVNFEGGSQWYRTWGGPSGVDIYGLYYLHAYGNLIAIDSDGNSYTAGVIGINFFSAYLYFKCLVKFNKEGRFLWSKIWGGNTQGNSNSRDIAIDSSNNIYLLGISSLDKFDSKGNLIWSKYGVYGNKIVIDSKNNIYVLGSTLAKYNFNGNLIWENGNINGISMDIDSEDNLYVIGNRDNDVLVSKYGIDSDGDGVSDWQEKNIYFTSPISSISHPLLYSIIFAIGGLLFLYFTVKYRKKLGEIKINLKNKGFNNE